MSQFNFIYTEEHLSHREKAVYIYLRDRADGFTCFAISSTSGS